MRVRILIAEDETIIRLDLRDLLERSGHEVVAEARDGEEAVELAREHEPELAVMDVKMPRLDGIEAAKRILDERPIPIVMLTAYGQEELVNRAVEGVDCALAQSIPGVDYDRGMALANRIHTRGQALVWSGHRELAELYHSQLEGYGLTMAPLER